MQFPTAILAVAVPAPVAVLAQAQRGMGSAFLWSLVLIGLVVAAAVVVLFLRRWYTSVDSSAGGGFTLGDIRQLHREGRMTDEEFEKAKALILGQARRGLEPKSPDKNAEGAGDVKLEE